MSNFWVGTPFDPNEPWWLKWAVITFWIVAVLGFWIVAVLGAIAIIGLVSGGK
jgi:hypothetical protein